MNVNTLERVSTKIYFWQMELCMVFFFVFPKFSTTIMDYLYNVLVKCHDILVRIIKAFKYLPVNIFKSFYKQNIFLEKKRHYNKSQEKALCCIGRGSNKYRFSYLLYGFSAGIIETQISAKV